MTFLDRRSDVRAPSEVPWRPLASLLGASGVAHLAVPEPYRAIVPRFLGDPAPWVRWSGLAELVCAAGLAWPRSRRAAGWASAALFVAVYPANVQMAATAMVSPRASTARRALLLARLPLQAPLITRSLRIATSEPAR